jgi:hypothetical protein
MKIYGKKPLPKKEIQLKLDDTLVPNKVYVCAVDDDGNIIANLVGIGDSGVIRCRNAKKCLDAEGYDTSKLRWTEEG